MILGLVRIILITIAVAAISINLSNNTASAFSNNMTDQQALVSVKKYITGDPLGVLSSWNHSTHLCNWKGVTCGRRHERVTKLDLSSQQLEGRLSPQIGNLTFLRTIYLHKNSFHGSIPSELDSLFRLRYLDLSNNYFRGGFPDNLTHCSEIRNISLLNNNLEGKLPGDQFGYWSKLNELILENNHFTGSIPPSIGNMSSLSFLDLGTNNLEGSIPLEVGQLFKLKIAIFQVNNFSGIVPLPLYNISSITTISLAKNHFKGSLPPDLGFTLPNLQQFFVGINNFSGPIPPSICNASNLERFSLASNKFIGPLQINFGRLPYLESLNLGYNQLGHNQPSGDLSFLTSLVNCSRLFRLGLIENGIRGELPNSIVNFSTTMQWLDLSDNYISGSIPLEIAKLVNLTMISLGDNILTGSIPEMIGQLSKLGELYLDGNNISGKLPASISNITELLIFSCHNNMLHGSIPAAFFNISSLLALDLHTNRLSGLIPEKINGLSSLSRMLSLDDNLFTGPLPSNIGSLKHLVALSVSHNQFTGEIPDTLGDCSMLEELYLDENYFEGRIPNSFKALKSLANLDLSSNNLSGNIPSFLGKFPRMKKLNLSHNRLEGEVPKEGVFSIVTAFSVVGNLQLCGGIQELQLPTCPVKFSKTRKKSIHSRIIPLLVLLPLALVLACLALFFYRLKKFKQKNIQLSALEDDRYPRVSYRDILLATSEFSRTNLIGEGRYGSVYRGVLQPLQQIVAVKVLNVEVHGANKSFVAECETLKNIRHRNLIKIITACSSTDFNGNDFKALVFEFMTNGSLDNWLHPEKERTLNLLQKLNISIDVALAVEYLHHRSHTRIIHCDIKPSNILLDEEFVARVGDFGLARFFSNTGSDINQERTSATGVRGTVGYVPPEYGMGGEVSAEGDVYSYGITLLELFSGKRPTDSSFAMENANNLHDYVRKALPHRVMDIVDPRIILQHDDHASYKEDTTEVCLATIFEVGILCSVETPKERIDISVALRKLSLARDLLLSHG